MLVGFVCILLFVCYVCCGSCAWVVMLALFESVGTTFVGGCDAVVLCMTC